MVATSGFLRAQRVLNQMARAARDLRPALSAVRDDFLARQRERYGEGAPPLSPAYAAWKAQHYPGAGILERTGRLRAGAMGASSDMATRITARSLRMVLSVPYAIFHARTVMPLEDADDDRWAALIERQLERAVARA